MTMMGQKLVTPVFAKWRWNPCKYATKPFLERDEVILKQNSVYRIDGVSERAGRKDECDD